MDINTIRLQQPKSYKASTDPIQSAYNITTDYSSSTKVTPGANHEAGCHTAVKLRCDLLIYIIYHRCHLMINKRLMVLSFSDEMSGDKYHPSMMLNTFKEPFCANMLAC